MYNHLCLHLVERLGIATDARGGSVFERRPYGVIRWRQRRTTCEAVTKMIKSENNVDHAFRFQGPAAICSDQINRVPVNYFWKYRCVVFVVSDSGTEIRTVARSVAWGNSFNALLPWSNPPSYLVRLHSPGSVSGD